MIEVRIHGRGGQGNVVAAYVLASAAFTEGWHAQAYPAFGAERRGAPVVAFVRLNKNKIRRRCEVAQPDFHIIQDEAQLQVPGLIDGHGVRPGLRNRRHPVLDSGLSTAARSRTRRTRTHTRHRYRIPAQPSARTRHLSGGSAAEFHRRLPGTGQSQEWNVDGVFARGARRATDTAGRAAYL